MSTAAGPATGPAAGAAATAVPAATRLRATAASEWIKFRSVRSVRSGPATLVAALLAMLLGAWWVSAGFHSGYSSADRASFDPGDVTLRGIIVAQLFVGALGVITVTGEYSSGLIRGTFIATPQRRRVLAMKALIFAGVVWFWCTALSLVRPASSAREFGPRVRIVDDAAGGGPDLGRVAPDPGDHLPERFR